MYKAILLITVIVFSACLSLSAQTTIYVNSSTGDDVTGTGAVGSPYKTFHKGYTAAASGDILDLNGTFTWTDADETGDAVTTGYTIAKNLTIKGVSTSSAIIQAATAENTADRRVLTISAGVTVKIVDVTIRYGNVNTGVNYDGGGGIKNSGTVYIDGCLVTRNRVHTGSSQLGGGILTDGSGTTTLVGSTISYNSAPGTSGWGGAIAHGNYGSVGALNMLSCMVNDNSSGGRGAMLVMLSNNSINKITNCTFYNNSAASYGAIFNDRSNTVYTNCTIAGNPNGGLAFYASSVYLKNNLMADNPGFDFSYNSSGTVYDAGYNLVETSTGYSFTGTGDITGNQPNLNMDASPAVNNTLNGTNTIALMSNSVAVDAGNATAHGPVGNQVTPALYDQRYYSRNGAVDIGAYEYNGTPSYAWSGGKNSNWNEAENWRSKSVPTGSFNLVLHPVITFNDLNLDQDRTVGILDLTNAAKCLRLNTYSITAASIAGGSASAYVKTNDVGVIKSNIINGSSLLFPVGNSAYNPVTITNNTGLADDFSVKVRDEVLSAGTTGSTLTGSYVQRSWDIAKTNPNGGSGINFVFNWNNGETSSSLSTPALFHYGGSWNKQTGTTNSTATRLTYTGYTGSFSPFAVMETSITLPVSWLSFTAVRNQQTVQLQWQTAAEQNTLDFEVQHRTANSNWKRIGTVAAAGNRQSVSSYRFTHLQPAEGNNYYRLIQRDADGKQSISKTVQVQFTTAVRMPVYPTPVTNGVLYVKLPAEVVIRIYNSSGSLVLKQKSKAGLQQLQLSQLSKGSYYLCAGTETATILVQ